MLTINQLKPLLDLIAELNRSAVGDGCKPPCVITDGAMLQQAADLAAALQRAPEPSTVEVLTALKKQGANFHDWVEAFGQNESNPFVRAARDRIDEGKSEVDEKTFVSDSENGAYVMSWTWVSNDTVVSDNKQAVIAAGYRVHKGEADAGDLEGRYWWTLTRDGRADIESSPDVFDFEDAAWLDAIARIPGEYWCA